MTTRICFPLTTRGNYAKVKSTLQALQKHPSCQAQIVVGGALLLERYGEFEALIEGDGFTISERIPYLVEGETLSDMTQSAARCTAEMGQVIESLAPDITFVVADRYEALSLAQAALCMNSVIAHLEGGESSGSIDDRIRHAISMLSELHFPATAGARETLLAFGIPDDDIHVVGTPSLDQLPDINLDDCSDVTALLDAQGQGATIDLTEDYVVVSQHPVVTEYEDAHRQFVETAGAVRALGLPTVWILPNLDAGAQHVTEPVHDLINDSTAPPVRAVGGLPFLAYAPLLHRADCLIGNTSSGLREAAFLGTPVVNIGTRQHARERGPNVAEATYKSENIAAAARQQLEHGRYDRNSLYGDGHSGVKIADTLAAFAAKNEQTPNTIKAPAA